jgi:predicted RNA-binding protein with PUA-like domain
MNSWLMKTEPDVFSWQHLEAAKNNICSWEGVRNYQARNFMMNDMKINDLVFFYHSSCQAPGIYGLCRVHKLAYPDPTQWDKKSDYFDPKATIERPRWFMVDLKLDKKLPRPLLLSELKTHPELEEMLLLRKGQRLSVQPIEKKHSDYLIKIAQIKISKA